MTHGSLFSGIGGFDLAAEWVGWQNIFHCEWNEFGQKVLKYHFPHSISYNDITKTDFTIHRGQIDILTGGFPCQPYSSAGKRKGKEDERHLWPEMLRAIREIQPRFVVGENVLGLVNWSNGLVFHEVQTDLEAAGYEVWPYVLPACAVNAPHRRDRIWFVAYSKNYGCDKRRERINKREKYKFCYRLEIRNIITSNGEKSNVTNTNGNGFICSNSKYEINASKNRINALNDINESLSNGNTTDTNGIGLWGEDNGIRNTNKFSQISEKQNVTDTKQFRLEHGKKRGNITESKTETQRQRCGITKQFETNGWTRFPTVSPICGGDDGLPTKLDGITFSKWRKESLKAYGNAIVPQVAYQIFKAIEEYSNKIYNK